MEIEVSIETEQIPILVTAAEKALFDRKAKSCGLSISEFARVAMDRFDPVGAGEQTALDGMITPIRRGTDEAVAAVENALAFCAASNERLNKLDAWMRERGYAP